MKIPLKAGRVIDQRDGKDSPLVLVINEAFARKHFPNANPIGQRVVMDREEGIPPSYEIVGVVGDSKHDEIGAPMEPEMYGAFAQDPDRRVFIVLRMASANLTGLDAAVRRAVLEFDKELFVPQLEPMTTLLAAQLARPRFNMILLAVFAAAAMILAAVGIYGVIAYSVTQRTREIGIRMALGAQRGSMLRMVLRQSFGLVAIGIGLGLIASLAGTRFARHPALWGRGERFVDVSNRGFSAGRGWFTCELLTRAASHECRSHGRAALRVRRRESNTLC